MAPVLAKALASPLVCSSAWALRGAGRMPLHEGVHLFSGKSSGLAHGNVSELETCLCHALQFEHCQAAVAAHAANLAVQALLQRYGKQGVPAVVRCLHARRGSDISFGKCHAVTHAGEGSVADFASHKDLVDLVLGMARVHEALGKLAHVGEKDEPFRVVVEAAYRKEAQVAVPLRNKIKDCPAALGIAGSGDYLYGLVQHEDDFFLFR